MYKFFFLHEHDFQAGETYCCPIYKWIGHGRAVRNSQGRDIVNYSGGIGFSIKNYSYHKRLFVIVNLFREDNSKEMFILRAYYVEKIGSEYEKWQIDNIPLYPYDSPHGRIIRISFSFVIHKSEKAFTSLYEYKFATLEEFYNNYTSPDDFRDGNFLTYNTFDLWHLPPVAIQTAVNEVNNFFHLPLYPSFTRGNTDRAEHPRHEIHKLIDMVIERKKNDPWSKHYIHMAVFNFDSPHITDHLCHALNNGVEIECIGGWEQVSSMDWHENIANIRRAGIPVYGVVKNIPHKEESGIASMHTKIIIFDGQASMTASFNLDFYKWGGNWENCIFHYSPHIALLYENTYQAIKGGHYFSPQININARFNTFYSFASYRSYDGRRYRPQDVIVREIRNARYNIYVVMFDINYLSGYDEYGNITNCISELINARHRGVNVTILFNGARVETGNFPELWDKDYNRPLKEPVRRLADCGVNVVRVYNPWDIYSPLHHKFAVFDDETVISGSYNWYTVSAISDEEMVLVRDREIAGKFMEEVRLILENLRIK